LNSVAATAAVVSLQVAAFKIISASNGISALDPIHYVYGFIHLSHKHLPGCLP